MYGRAWWKTLGGGTVSQEKRLGLKSDKGKPNRMQEEKLIIVLHPENIHAACKWGNDVNMK